MTTAVIYAKMPRATCDGSNRVFPFDFPIYDETDLRVVLTNSSEIDSDLVIDTDYTVILNTDQAYSPGGYILTQPAETPLPAGNFVTVVSEIPNTQDTFLPSVTAWNPRTVMFALDRLTRLAVQLQEQVDRSLKLPLAEVNGLGVTFPKSAERASHYMLFDEQGNATLAPNVLSEQVVPTAFSENLIETATDANSYINGLGITDFARDNVLFQASGDAILVGCGLSTYGITVAQSSDASALLSTFGFSNFFTSSLAPQANADDFMSVLGFSTYARTTLIALPDASALAGELGISAFAFTLLDDVDASAFLTTLGVSAFIQTLLDDVSDSDARTTLGLGTIATQDADDVVVTGGSISGTEQFANWEKGATVSSASGVLTLDYSVASSFVCTLTENIGTIQITNVPAAGKLAKIELILVQAASAKTVAWNSSIYKAPGGTLPTMSTGNGAVDIHQLRSADGGTTWYVDFQNDYS